MVHTVLCDDCLSSAGNQSEMTFEGGKALALPANDPPVAIGDLYRCTCGRMYGTRAGYFTIIEGQGVVRSRLRPRCDCNPSMFHYISAIRGGGVVLNCPNCSSKSEQSLLPVQ